MLTLIDESLEAFLRAMVPLSAVDIDVSFDAPDDEWTSKLTRPTVNLHLWDVRRSNARAVTGVEQVDRDGVQVRRMALPRVELRYAVTAWTTEYDDERTLLGALLVALLGHQAIPDAFLSDGLAGLPNPQLNLARTGDNDVYSVEGRIKLGLQLMVMTAVDTGLGEPLAPEVSEIALGVRDTESGADDAPVRRIAGEVHDPAAVGVPVRSPRGVSTVNPGGRFLISARAGDEIVVETEPPQRVTVPPIGGVVVGR